VVTAVVVGLVSLRKRVARETGISEDLPLFGAIAASGGIIGFLFYLYSAGLPTQPWYWLPLMTFLAVCVEAVFGQWLARQRGWTLAVVAIFVAASFVTSLGQIRFRQTNIDRVAARLHEAVGPNDLVIVYPWFCGISFHRYYHGPAPWTTIPELEDHRLHRYDQLKVKMQETKPIQPILEKIRTTLSSGGKVWLVGRLPGPKPGETAPPELPPAPNGPWGWYDPPYDYSWGRQVEHFIRTNARQMEVIPISGTNGYTRYENVALSVVTGSSGSY
jgi:hypothetical protein